MKKKYYFLLFIMIFIFTFLYTWFRLALICDEVWNYGVAYNIANGMVPYRDFNLLTGPLYPFLGSLFIRIFGHHLYSFEIFNAVIVSLIFLVCFYKIGKSAFIIYFVLVCYAFPNYNIFCLLLLFTTIVINEENELKFRDFFIGFFVGIVFISKFSIGLCLFFVMISFSNNRLKKFLSFLIPLLVLSLYLFFNDAFFQWIDYNYLGLFEFGKKNNFVFYLPVFIVLTLFLMYKVIKSRFKDTSLLYAFAFTSVSIPIFDNSHFLYALLGCLFYFLLRYKENVDKNYKYYLIMSLSFFIFSLTSSGDEYSLYSDSSSFLYGKNGVDSILFETLKSEVNKVRDNYAHVFIFSNEIAYAVKLDINYPLSKFDMIANGNMGYDGANKLIKSFNKIYSNDSCVFFVDVTESVFFSQTNRDILEYVKEKYNYIDAFSISSTNSNEKKVYSFLIYNNEGNFKYE